MKLLMKVSLVSLIMMAFLISTAGAQKIDLKGLLLYYPCDESSGNTLKDASGRGFDGEINNAKWEKGVFGNAVRIQKTNSKVVGDIISSTAKTGEISIGCWVNMSVHSTYNGLVSIASPACDSSCCYRLMINPTKNPFWNAGHHVDMSLANFVFELKTWYHYIMVTDKKGTKIYVNGELIGEVPEAFKLPELKDVSVYVGTGESPGTWLVEDAAIDEVMIWDKALTEDDIKLLMEGPKIYLAVDLSGKLATTWAGLKSK